MTRVPPASQFKRGARVGLQSVPREGTKLRALYDAFRRGEIIITEKGRSGLLVQLRDFYGMEFEHVGVRKGFRLRGEWDGPIFVPLSHILGGDQL